MNSSFFKIFFATFILSLGIHATVWAQAGSIEIQPDVPAYIATPELRDQNSFPAIILIHEWWGLTPQIKDLADQFAAKGYVALAVDLYRGKETLDPGEAHELMRGLPEDRAYGDLKQAVTYLQNHKLVDRNRVGVIGWCMGGGYALELGVRDIRLKAVVMYYGKVITNEDRLLTLKAPLLGIFGALDRGISAKDVDEFKIRLERLGKSAEIHLYPEAGHAFANPLNPNYRKDDADDAWHKTLLFFKQHLI